MAQIETKMKEMEQLEKKDLIKLLEATKTRYSFLLTEYQELRMKYLNTVEIYQVLEQDYQTLEKELLK